MLKVTGWQRIFELFVFTNLGIKFGRMNNWLIQLIKVFDFGFFRFDKNSKFD